MQHQKQTKEAKQIPIAKLPHSTLLTEQNNYYDEFPFEQTHYYSKQEQKDYIILVRKRFEQLSMYDVVGFEEPAIYKYDILNDEFIVLDTVNDIEYYPFVISSITIDPINEYLYIIITSPQYKIKIFNLKTNQFIPTEYKYKFDAKFNKLQQFAEYTSVIMIVLLFICIKLTLIQIGILFVFIAFLFILVFAFSYKIRASVYKVDSYFVAPKAQLHLFGYTDNNYTCHIIIDTNKNKNISCTKMKGIVMNKILKYGYNQILYLEKAQIFVNMMMNSNNSCYWSIKDDDKDEWINMNLGYLRGLRSWIEVYGCLLVGSDYQNHIVWIDAMLTKSKYIVEGKNSNHSIFWYARKALHVNGYLYKFGIDNCYKLNIEDFIPLEIRKLYFTQYRKFVIGYLRRFSYQSNIEIPQDLVELIATYYPIFVQ